MKNSKFFSFGLMAVLILSLSFQGCVKDLHNNGTDIVMESTPDFNAVAKISSPDALSSVLRNGNGTLTRSDFGSVVEFEENFVSLMNVSHVNEATSLPVTYYEVLHYEDLVPNTDLASLLNTKGEIQVGELMYRITPAGTYYFAPSLRAEVDAMIEQLDQTPGELIGDYTVQLSDGIVRYNTFEEAQETVMVEDSEFYSDDPNWFNDEYWDNLEITPETRALGNIPGINSFPRYNAASHTVVGGWIENLFGRNKAYYVKFSDKRRLKGKLYYYKYVFYDEMGLLGKTQKKNWIGWSEVNCDEMAIGWRGVITELKLNTPNPPSQPNQKNVYGGTYTGPIPGTGNTGKIAVVLGVDINSAIFKNALKAGSSAIFGWLKTLANGSSAVNGTQALLVAGTDKKVYCVIVDDDIHKTNTGSIRKVFASDFHFMISLNLTSLPSDWKGWLNTVSGGQGKLPTKSLKQAECVVAARIGTTWKGMRLYKE